jgi:TonB-dependent SusC/RagA subfamily outer membrane receptor
VIKQREEQQRMAEANAVINNLRNSVSLYNERISWWSKTEKPISLKEVEQKYEEQIAGAVNGKNIEMVKTESNEPVTGDFKFGSSSLQEVVVVGYSSQKRLSITGSSSVVRASEIRGNAMNVQQALEGRVAGLSVEYNGSPGAAPKVFIRGAQTLGNDREPLYVLDGIPVDGDWASSINVNDIESITVLKDAQAGVLYGSRASNGAIVITTKRGFRNTSQYNQGVAKYKNLEDVEYVTELKEADKKDKYNNYLQMKDSLGKDPAFYFDAAQLLFESGDKEEALRILTNLAEMDNESHQLLRAMGYMLETWGMYTDAIDVYKKVLNL